VPGQKFSEVFKAEADLASDSKRTVFFHINLVLLLYVYKCITISNKRSKVM
jgi:hypothetical protein